MNPAMLSGCHVGDLSSLQQSDEKRTRYIEEVGCLLRCQLLMKRDHGQGVALQKMGEVLAE